MIRHPVRFLVCLCSLALLLQSCNMPGYAPDVYVSPGGSDSNDCLSATTSCASIQQAFSRVQTGGTIHLAAGDYVPAAQAIISRFVILEGAGQTQTFLYMTSGMAGGSILYVVTGGGLIMRSLTLSGARITAADNSFYGLWMQPRMIVDVNDCVIRGFGHDYGKGIRNEGGFLLIENSLFAGNRVAIENTNLDRSQTSISDTVFQNNASAISNDGTVRMTNVTVIGSGRIAPGATTPAVFNGSGGHMRILESSFQDNFGTAVSSSGETSSMLLDQVDVTGTQQIAISSINSHTTISNSVIHDNLAEGIELSGGSLQLNMSVVRDNAGAGIWIQAADTPPTLGMNRSAVIRSQREGLFGEGNAAITIQNSTFSRNNLALAAGSGGLHLTSGSLLLQDATIMRNEGFGISSGGAAVTLQRSLVAINTAEECLSGSGGSITGRSDFACNESQTAASLHVSALTAQAGTFVHALLEGSPLIDAAGRGCPDVDQRGALRPVGGGCDVGAYEFSPALVAESDSAATPTGIIPLPTSTSTPQAPGQVTFAQNANCRKGPGTAYNIVTSFEQGKQVQATGRNDQSTWVYLAVPGTTASCWVAVSTLDPNVGLDSLPVVPTPPLPDTPATFSDKASCVIKLKSLSVKLTWADVSNESGYHLYRNGTLLTTLDANVTFYVDASAPLGKDLLYELEAFNEYGASERLQTTVTACK